MPFKIFKKKVEMPEYVEVEALPERVGVVVKVDTLNDLSDASRIQQLIRDGNIVFARIKELRKRDIDKLKRAVDRIKRTCVAVGGDLVGVNEDFLIITPKDVKIVK